jgi:hypothetical protein
LDRRLGGGRTGVLGGLERNWLGGDRSRGARFRRQSFRRVGEGAHFVGRRCRGFAFALDRRAFDLVGRAVARALGTCGAAPGAAVGLRLGGALGALLLSDQCLPIGDGDLVIVGMNFAEGEKSVTIPAVVDKGSLQRWFDPCDLG